MKRKVSVMQFMASVIKGLEAEERFSTAHVYKATLVSLSLFMGGGELYFSALTPGWLKQFETFLRDGQRQWNTVSTYMRMLRATYNRAVAQGLVPYTPALFAGVYTGVKRERKLALSAKAMHQLVYAVPRKPLSPKVEESREWLRMMFQLQGMPFVDLTHLHHADLDRDKRTLSCHRQKTSTSLEVSLPATTMKWIAEHRNNSKESSPYLLNILSGATEGLEAYEEYQRKLRSLNRNLKKLADIQGITARVSSYTARHTWATLAKSCGIPEGLICDALGHTSVKTTEAYLKSFDNKSLERANSRVIGLVKRAVTV